MITSLYVIRIGLHVLSPEGEESVLLGSAILARAASDGIKVCCNPCIVCVCACNGDYHFSIRSSN